MVVKRNGWRLADSAPDALAFGLVQETPGPTTRRAPSRPGKQHTAVHTGRRVFVLWPRGTALEASTPGEKVPGPEYGSAGGPGRGATRGTGGGPRLGEQVTRACPLCYPAA
jgi:hypothetical protein